MEITSEEMYHFLGILLQISITPMDSGGYKAYFSNNNQRISYRRGDEPVEISNSAGFAHNYMSIRRFMQIRGAFHPEDKALAAGGDKCYQIRYALNSFKEASKRTWFPPKDVTFDEGGVGCRSRYCPVRQYNKDKPQKYRVDFFIMAASKGYHILHLDVYQGKNQSNIGIASHLTDLPTTQKAVVNACQHLGFHKESARMRHISMDNRYQCPQLAVLLRERFNCFSTGTARASRKGWPKDFFSEELKKQQRGSYRMVYDKQNRVVCGEWLDSKVVRFVSSLNVAKIGQVQRQLGANKVSITCPEVLKKYQEDMGSIDRNDQMRMHGGGFSAKGHFKKWYKRIYLAIFDSMMLNTLFAWNYSRLEVKSWLELKRFELFSIIAEQMTNFKESNHTIIIIQVYYLTSLLYTR